VIPHRLANLEQLLKPENRSLHLRTEKVKARLYAARKTLVLTKALWNLSLAARIAVWLVVRLVR
jgi:hypothetical protein